MTRKKTAARPARPARNTILPQGGRLETSEGWVLARKPLDKTVRRQSGADDSTQPVLPDFMSKGDFEVLDAAEIAPSATRRSSAGGEVPLRATVPADASVLLVIRQESGAISFRRPNAVVHRSARRGKAVEVEVEFEVPVLAGDPQDRRRGLLSLVSAVLVKLVKKAADFLIDPLAELTVPYLARRLEERLWKGRHQGWLRMSQSALAAKTLPPAVPDFPESERGLLFLHGTFSSAASAFGDLAQAAFFEALHGIYGENIFAFDHFTFSKTLDENAKDLLAALPGRTFHFDVITHSRGGLVLRTLAEATAKSAAKTAQMRIGRVILVASPNQGTPLVTSQHWDDKLAWFANLLEMIPDHPLVTAADWLTNALIWFADKVVGNAPGLTTMDMQGEVIAGLQSGGGAPSGAAYYALASNFHPPQKWWSRLADMGVDTFFGGANDLVVLTEGGWQVDANPAAWLPADHIGCFGLAGNLAQNEPSAVHHLNFFSRSETAEFLVHALRGEPLAIPALAAQQPLPTRRNARGFNQFSPQSAGTGSLPSIAPQPSVEAQPAAPETSVKPDGWGDEDNLTLTVIAHAEHTDIEQDNTVPLLLATYAGARVTVPFYTQGRNDNAGKRWQQIINMHKFMVDYANGKNPEFTLEDGAKIDKPTDAFLQAFGRVLFETLFPNAVRRLYDAARFRHDKRRLNIVFTSMIPWVADFPWEFAFDVASETFLATADVRFVRNVLTPLPEDRFPVESKRLRILVVSAQPSGSVPLSIEEEKRGIASAFKPLVEAGLVEVEVIPRATPTLLHEAVRYRSSGQDYDIVHFIGHGEFDSASSTGYVLFEDEDGRQLRLSASQLLDILRSRGIRVVFLNACETGRGAGADYNRGVAMALVRDGIPSVVANQYSVLDRAASLFSLHFYACLACGLKIGDAMREARIAIRYSGVEPMDWGVPVLFARNPNARLCESNGARKPSRSLVINPPNETVSGMCGPLATRSDTTSAPGANSRGVQPASRLKIAVWDVANALPYRENLDATLAEMNAAQDQFYFKLEKMTAPRGLWTADASSGSDVAYLQAERVAPKMEEIRVQLGVDYLFCVTDLPLRDAQTKALYLWGGGGDGPVESSKVFIMSIWPFEPPLRGHVLKAAFANCIAAALAQELSGVAPRKNEPKFSIGYFNAELDVAHLAGRLRITPDNCERMQRKGLISPAQVNALEKLLALFHPSEAEEVHPQEAVRSHKAKAKAQVHRLFYGVTLRSSPATKAKVKVKVKTP